MTADRDHKHPDPSDDPERHATEIGKAVHYLSTTHPDWTRTSASTRDAMRVDDWFIHSCDPFAAVGLGNLRHPRQVIHVFRCPYCNRIVHALKIIYADPIDDQLSAWSRTLSPQDRH